MLSLLLLELLLFPNIKKYNGYEEYARLELKSNTNIIR